MKGRSSDYAFVGVLAVAGVVFLQVVYRPALQDVAAKGRQIRSTLAEICRSEDFTRGLDDLERYLAEFETAIESLDRLVPAQVVAEVLVGELTEVVEECGLRARSMRPDAAAPQGTVTAHPINLKLAGTYAQVLRFLFAVEALPRHTRVTRLTLAQGLEPQADLEADVEVTSYSVGDAP